MKRTLAITAATAMLVLSLAGCGAERYDGAATGPDGTNTDGRTATDTMHGGEAGLDSVTGAVNRAAPYAGRYGANRDVYTATNNGGMLSNGVDYADEAAVKRAAQQGDRYARMLENARVHDSDGLLFDGENASYSTY